MPEWMIPQLKIVLRNYMAHEATLHERLEKATAEKKIEALSRELKKHEAANTRLVMYNLQTQHHVVSLAGLPAALLVQHSFRG